MAWWKRTLTPQTALETAIYGGSFHAVTAPLHFTAKLPSIPSFQALVKVLHSREGNDLTGR